MSDEEPHPWGLCQVCHAEQPLDTVKTGFRLASHAGRNGAMCHGSGSKAGHIFLPSPADEPARSRNSKEER